MTAQQLKPRVLVIGLNPYRVPGPWDPKPVAEAIEAGMTKFANHGVGAQSCLFGLDGSDNPEEMVTAALQSQPWECVIIGGGVRTAEDRPLYCARTRVGRQPRVLPTGIIGKEP